MASECECVTRRYMITDLGTFVKDLKTAGYSLKVIRSAEDRHPLSLVCGYLFEKIKGYAKYAHYAVISDNRLLGEICSEDKTVTFSGALDDDISRILNKHSCRADMSGEKIIPEE